MTLVRNFTAAALMSLAATTATAQSQPDVFSLLTETERRVTTEFRRSRSQTVAAAALGSLSFAPRHGWQVAIGGVADLDTGEPGVAGGVAWVDSRRMLTARISASRDGQGFAGVGMTFFLGH